MLVLSRKIGERVVLPDCGVTIEVVSVSGKRVRLGIAAPLDTPIHRNEIWQRICQANGNGSKEDGAGRREEDETGRGEGGNGQRPNGDGAAPLPIAAAEAPGGTDARIVPPGCNGKTPPRSAAETLVRPSSSPAGEPDDLDGSLARWIVRRTGGRIRSLSVQRVGGRLLIQGSTGSYYARQLAQAAVSEMLGALGGAAPAEVDISIHVVND